MGRLQMEKQMSDSKEREVEEGIDQYRMEEKRNRDTCPECGAEDVTCEGVPYMKFYACGSKYSPATNTFKPSPTTACIHRSLLQANDKLNKVQKKSSNRRKALKSINRAYQGREAVWQRNYTRILTLNKHIERVKYDADTRLVKCRDLKDAFSRWLDLMWNGKPCDKEWVDLLKIMGRAQRIDKNE